MVINNDFSVFIVIYMKIYELCIIYNIYIFKIVKKLTSFFILNARNA